MAQNGSEWLRMAQNGSEWLRMAQAHRVGPLTISQTGQSTRVFYDGLVMSEYFETNVLEL